MPTKVCKQIAEEIREKTEGLEREDREVRS